jgi:hypothetical protein
MAGGRRQSDRQRSYSGDEGRPMDLHAEEMLLAVVSMTSR